MPIADEMVIARAEELAGRSGGSFTASRFLTPHEQAVFFRAVAGRPSGALERLFFYGGCRGAERRAAVFFPEWADISDAPPVFPDTPLFSPEREEYFHTAAPLYGGTEVHGIVCFLVRGSGYKTLGHRDYMGSVLALGIDRSALGDVSVVSGQSAMVFLRREVAPFVRDGLERVGSDKVSLEEVALPTDHVPARNVERIAAVAASMRLDALTGAVFSLSRSEAKELIDRALAEVNYMTEDRADRTVAPGDVISLRGYGKFTVGEAVGTTRSGKLRIEIEKYV